MAARSKGLQNLPVELLYEVQLYATSENLPLISTYFHCVYSSTPTSFRAQYLLGRLCPPANTNGHGFDLISKALRYPLCTQPVLEALCRRLKASGIHFTITTPQLPRRLFRGLQPKTATADRWKDRDPPLPLLRYLYSQTSFPPPDPNSHDGYALTKAVHARFLPLVEFLLENGASPRCKSGLAVLVAIRMKDIKMVKMLVERDGRRSGASHHPLEPESNDTRASSSGRKRKSDAGRLAPGKKRRLEDRIEVTSEMLKTAVKCQATEVVEYLTNEKGCVPDMQTLLMMTR